MLHLLGPICPDHGVPWFVYCPSCGAMWPLVPPMDDFAASELFTQEPERAFDFCPGCAAPGQWLSREKQIEWIRNQIRADRDMSGGTRLELLAVMDRLQTMDPHDTKALAGWQAVKKLAPKRIRAVAAHAARVSRV